MRAARNRLEAAYVRHAQPRETPAGDDGVISVIFGVDRPAEALEITSFLEQLHEHDFIVEVTLRPKTVPEPVSMADLTHGLEGLVERNAEMLDADPESSNSFRIELFGSFGLTSLDTMVQVGRGNGKPVQLLKLLTLLGGRAHIEVLVEHLWPGLAPDVGRKRLKNVLNRARSFLDAEAIVRRGDCIQFSEVVDSDFAEFQRLVSTAATNPPRSEEFVTAARSAVELTRKGLLPDDIYLDWASDERSNVEMTVDRLTAQLG